MADLTIDQTRVVTVTNEYQVTTTAVSANGMPTEVFVYKADTATYDHIATIGDLENYPTTPTSGVPFYRSNTVTQIFDNPQSAQTAADLHKSRLNDLVAEVNAGALTFPGTDTGIVLTGV